MIIRKQYKFEGAHVVRNCYSNRCKFSIHGHSYIVEVFLEARGLDNAGMVLDFGLLKNEVSDFIDAFDHCIAFWAADDPAYIEAAKKFSDRWIEMPVSPSAENLAYTMLVVIDALLGNTHLNNGEPEFAVSSVRVHETATGYAEAFHDDMQYPGFPEPKQILEGLTFSSAVFVDWKNSDMFSDIGHIPFVYDQPEQQV